MSADEHKMPEGAEGGLPAKLAPKEQAKKLPKSALPEESSEIQQLVNTLSQAAGVYGKRIQEVKIPRVKISKRGCPSFFSMQIWYISNHQIVERIC